MTEADIKKLDDSKDKYKKEWARLKKGCTLVGEKVADSCQMKRSEVFVSFFL